MAESKTLIEAANELHETAAQLWREIVKVLRRLGELAAWLARKLERRRG